MKTIKNNPIGFYVLLVGILSILPYSIMLNEGNSESDLGTFILMWIPAIAAIIHRLLISKSIFKGLGWNPIISIKWMTFAMILPLLISVITVGLQASLGFVEYNNAFISLNDGDVEIRGVAMIFGAGKQLIPFFIGNFLLSFFVGNLLYMIAFALGEEYGWRAHLQTLLLDRFTPYLTFSILGVIWGLWHFPGILLGHNYPDYPWVGGLILMPITCIAFSIVMGLAYLKSNSVWVPVMLHSAINLSSTMDNKMIIFKTNTIGADLIWTGVWIVVALLIILVTSSKSTVAPNNSLHRSIC